MSKAKAKEPFKGGMPRFIPTDDERALVKLLTANGYARLPGAVTARRSIQACGAR